jgi:flagellin
MIIAHDINALRIINNITKLQAYSSKLITQLSSGLRINNAADDPAGLAISEKMRAQIRGLNQAARNSQDAISLMQVSEGALNETHSILQRVRELIVQASNGTYNPGDRESIQKEIDSLIEEVDKISEYTQYNTLNLLDGTYSKSKKGLTFQTGANSGQEYTIFIEDMGSEALGVENINIIGKSSEEISSYLDVVDKAISGVSSQRSSLGASINVMEMRIDYLNTTAENLEAAESRIRDVDVAKAIMEFTKTQILLKISFALLAQANQTRENALMLLFGDFESKN